MTPQTEADIRHIHSMVSDLGIDLRRTNERIDSVHDRIHDVLDKISDISNRLNDVSLNLNYCISAMREVKQDRE